MSLRKTRSQTKATRVLEVAEVVTSRCAKGISELVSLDDAERATKRTRQYVSLDDVRFLEETKKQMSALDLPANSIRAKTIDVLNQYLRRLRPIEQNDICTPHPAAHLLTAKEARCLLGSRTRVKVPVFVSGCGLPSTLNGKASEPPIEQLFEWHKNDQDQHEAPNVEATEEKMGSHTVRQIKEAFRQHNGYRNFHKNFVDIPSNLPGAQIPNWLATPMCSFLNDLMGTVIDNSVEDTFKAQMLSELEETLNIQNEDGKPIPNLRELAEISMAWRHWQTTIMLAEAGAITLPHWDRYGVATWIHCIEGEMGFTWLTKPTKTDFTAWMRQRIRGNWMLIIIRPSDALYMPGGTVHFVFRLPRGKQTASFAENMVRHCEVSD